MFDDVEAAAGAPIVIDAMSGAIPLHTDTILTRVGEFTHPSRPLCSRHRVTDVPYVSRR